MITDYNDLHALAEGDLVRDAAGQVWQIHKYTPSFGRDQGITETWLLPFSDEYSFQVRENGNTVAFGADAPLPIEHVKTVAA